MDVVPNDLGESKGVSVFNSVKKIEIWYFNYLGLMFDKVV